MFRTLLLGFCFTLMLAVSAQAKCGLHWQADIERFLLASFGLNDAGLPDQSYDMKDFERASRKSEFIRWSSKTLYVAVSHKLTDEEKAVIKDKIIPAWNEQVPHHDLRYTASSNKAKIVIYLDPKRAHRAGLSSAKQDVDWYWTASARGQNSALTKFNIFVSKQEPLLFFDTLAKGDVAGRVNFGLMASLGIGMSGAAIERENYRDAHYIIYPPVVELAGCKAIKGGTNAAAAIRQIRKGSGAQTRRVQQALANLDFKPGPVDGAYGKKTGTALLAYLEDREAQVIQPWITKDVINFMVANGDMDGEVFDDPDELMIEEGAGAEEREAEEKLKENSI